MSLNILIQRLMGSKKRPDWHENENLSCEDLAAKYENWNGPWVKYYGDYFPLDIPGTPKSGVASIGIRYGVSGVRMRGRGKRFDIRGNLINGVDMYMYTLPFRRCSLEYKSS